MKKDIAIALSLFANRIEAICDEMGAVLQKTAFSPNIKDRLDFSCAIFDHSGALCAQAAHIPVHMGSMAYAMRDIVKGVHWHKGDMVILNDPYLGGTHLPDVTVIAPLFMHQSLVGFVTNRAHHADIGAETPGSMPISTSLQQEGIIIAPTLLVKAEKVCQDVLEGIYQQTKNREQTQGDFAAQISANRTGLMRLKGLVESMGIPNFRFSLGELNRYAQRLARSALDKIPDGDYCYTDVMDDDGVGHFNLPIKVKVSVTGHHITIDFAGTAPQTAGNINCPISVAAAAVYYVFRCLMPVQTPNCQGSFNTLTIKAPSGSLLNANFPAAVAAGNVETSMRIVDVVMGALATTMPEFIPAASQGSMNNLAMGARVGQHDNNSSWDYYETIGGGMGAGYKADGLSAVQSHMTNTRNTPIEVLEMHYPIRINRYQIRDHSGGAGIHRGGDGIIREYEFLAPATVTLLTERRLHQPWGSAGGKPGAAGRNLLNGEPLPSKYSGDMCQGDKLTIETPGGGGWGDESQLCSPTVDNSSEQEG